MSLYHLMADIGAVPSKVIPKIPANAMKEEDQSIPRICVSRSLDECLTGITVTGITFPFFARRIENFSYKANLGQTISISFHRENLLCRE